MNKKISLGAAVTFMCIVAAVTFSITMVVSARLFDSKVFNIKEREAMYNKLANIDQLVRTNYSGEIDEENLLDYLAIGYLAGINDPYASYMRATEYETAQKNSSGKSIGIGMEIVKDSSGYYVVTDVYANSPAEGAGMKRGDLIVSLGGKDLSQVKSAELNDLLYGDSGSTLSLTLRREGEDIPLDVVRRECEITSVYSRMIGEDGYIRISQFNDATVKQFASALASLQSQGAKSLIFDLRDNGGGIIKSAAEILDTLLPEGDIVSGTMKDGQTKVLYTSDANEVDLPMVVITNKNTASAAELFAAAIRDYNKGKLVGQNTYGKGVMQGTYKLTDGSAVEMTIGYFNPPSGQNFQGVGLKPDFESALSSENEKKLYSLTDEQDTQLKKAIEVANSLKNS